MTAKNIPAPDNNEPNEPRLRALPAVGTILARPAIAAAIGQHGHAVVARAVREAIGDARRNVLEGDPSDAATAISDDDVCSRAQQIARGTLQRVINATGVIVHTNLGRAPLAPEAVDAIRDVATGYVTLEYDLDEGGRGERDHHAKDLLLELTGAEDALVVNNNAGAVLLALAANAAGRDVIVSRGELVEIGGGFRIPDVLAQSGARLVEVGTTNRTHVRDYERAMNDDTRLLLKVHRSNFALVGFTAEVSLRELTDLAHARGVAVACDAGSGCMSNALASAEEPTVASLVSTGADLVMFSGDKMLGGPQAGIVVGRSRLIEPMRRHPLMRALRPDKLCLAALVATLRLWRDAEARVPVLALASVTASELERRSKRLAARIGASGAVVAVPTIARIGGGAAPVREIPSWGVRVTTRDAVAFTARLRAGDRPIVGRIDDGAVILDLRCVPPADDDHVASVLLAALASNDA